MRRIEQKAFNDDFHMTDFIRFFKDTNRDRGRKLNVNKKRGIKSPEKNVHDAGGKEEMQEADQTD